MASPFDTLRAVLFDLDGTLIETHIDFPAMVQAMRELACDAQVPESVITDKDILGIVDAASADVTARGGDGAALRRTAFARLEILEMAGCAKPQLIPGSRRLLSYLSQHGVQVGIVTRNCRRVSEILLSEYALPYHVLLTRDDVRRTKPHPDHLWKALDILGQPPQFAAMVGDHWMDVQAGNAAGCAVTIGIRGKHDLGWFASCPPTIAAIDLNEVLPFFID